MLHGIGFYEMTAHLTTRIEHHKKRAGEFEEKAAKVMEAFEKFSGSASGRTSVAPDYSEIVGGDFAANGRRRRTIRYVPETGVEAERRRAEDVVSLCRQAQAEHLQRAEEFSFVAAHLKNKSGSAPTRDFLELSYDELVTFEFIKPRGLQNRRMQLADEYGLELCDVMDFKNPSHVISVP